MLCSTPLESPARIRLMGDSFLYASSGLVSRACRHAVSLLFSVGAEPMEVQWCEGSVRARAVLVRPLVNRWLRAARTPFVLLDLEPMHAGFRSFSLAQTGPGVQPLELPAVQALHELALQFHAGQWVGPELDAQLRAAVGRLAAAWFDPGPLDKRVAAMMRAIERNACTSLEALAQAQALSPTHASRLFSAQVGIPARAYALAAKVRVAAGYMGSGRRLTDVAMAAGFADSAHFAKVWLRSYGAPPSRYFALGRTAVDAQGSPQPARWPKQRVSALLA